MSPHAKPKAKPTKQKKYALLLTPGASANRNQSALVAIDDAASAMGIAVARVDFPYTKAGRKAPDKPAVLLQTIVDEAAQLASDAGVKADRVFLGGRSMGGRICSLAVADGLPAAGLVLVSYPLHPPGRPEKLRTEHFGAIDVPCLFLSGTRDAFGSPAELEAATAGIHAPVTHLWLEGCDHGLRGQDATVAAQVAGWLAAVS
ncbi:MAG: dienelactone hydrolase [Actinobacteria bacterium]|nr:dienelactone hydrolase [Actinomycetota bacterium]MBV9252715.1 dienelactone hydrolase [Actinomycetota bacterium]MBV9666013.1 dienelactone hydrolase [Actinomycetota bacterium]MBV9936089.1 dienelactone hydrolase [Actinomycetota bacterium]